MGSEPAVERRLSNSDEERDESRLAQFGYKQELKRDWGLAHNFGVSFSIIVRSSVVSMAETVNANCSGRVSSLASPLSFPMD